MGKPTGFLDYNRKTVPDRTPKERIADFNEFHYELSDDERKTQGARCMDCGVPFCHSAYGCPVSNLIPEWNELIFQGRFKDAYDRLRKTNNFPEFTGRVCPAPCEFACVCTINDPAVTIKQNECFIIDRAWEEGWVQPLIPVQRTGKKIAVVGSGPAGLAAADQLNRAGHSVVVFERADRIGGLLMYGIPNMKLDKGIVDKRVDLMRAEGVVFKTGVEVGKTLPFDQLETEFDAILLACGSTVPRDLKAPGRELSGVHFAMDFLTAQTKNALDGKPQPARFNAAGKHVIVIGGGDTGNDCIGTSVRHGAASVVNFELLPEPPVERPADQPWPTFPRLLKIDYGHEEAITVYGKDPRVYCILTKEFTSDGKGNVNGIKTVRVEWIKKPEGGFDMKEIPGSEEFYQADLVLLALGFVGADPDIVSASGVQANNRGSVEAGYGTFTTSKPGVFAAGDVRRGQSLVVWAINEGRAAAREIDRFLMGSTILR